MFVPYGGQDPIVDEDGPYNATDPDRQFLHYVLPPDASPSEPAPVVIFAHGNGGRADMNEQERDAVTSAGYALVSWESVTTVESQLDLETAVDDLELVRAWIKANGGERGLSPDTWIISGRSRGSVCSWFTAHSGTPEVIGCYMYNALPNPNISVYLDEISASSPPIYLAYGPKCPVPIITTGDDVCVVYKTDENGTITNNTDIHNPISGVKVVDRYTDLGMADKLGLGTGFRQGLESENIRNMFVDFGAFAAWLDESESLNEGNQAPTLRMPSLLMALLQAPAG